MTIVSSTNPVEVLARTALDTTFCALCRLCDGWAPITSDNLFRVEGREKRLPALVKWLANQHSLLIATRQDILKQTIFMVSSARNGWPVKSKAALAGNCEAPEICKRTMLAIFRHQFVLRKWSSSRSSKPAKTMVRILPNSVDTLSSKIEGSCCWRCFSPWTRLQNRARPSPSAVGFKKVTVYKNSVFACDLSWWKVG